MGTPKKTYVISDTGMLSDVVRQLNDELLRVSEDIADKTEVGGLVYRGDYHAFDFTEADLTTDNAWYELDLSSIVPAGACAVLLYVRVKDADANSHLQFRKRGSANTANRSEVRTQVADIYNHGDLFVFCDSNRRIEYKAGEEFSEIDITVKGWIIE